MGSKELRRYVPFENKRGTTKGQKAYKAKERAKGKPQSKRKGKRETTKQKKRQKENYNTKENQRGIAVPSGFLLLCG